MDQIFYPIISGFVLIVFAFLCSKLYLFALKRLAKGDSSKTKVVLIFVVFVVFLLAFHFGNRLIMSFFFPDHSK